MKILLFNPMIKAFYKPMTSPLGILSIASFLNANGHDASICDRFFSNESIESVIESNRPDIIGISLITNRFMEDAADISKEAKKRGIPVVWGGPLSSEIPEEILRSGLADYISFNEGEMTWLEIANALKENKPIYDIKGLGYLSENKFIKTPDREFIDLCVLPPIDWTLIDPQKYFQPYYESKKMLYMYSSKGCIGKCTFCYNPRFHCSTHRRRPISQVIEEIKYLVEKHGMDGINFSDDLLFCNRNQAVDFCDELIRNEIKVFWGGSMRIGIINTLEDFEYLYKAGCRWLQIGVESGSKHMQKVINKAIPFEKTVKTIELCSKAGIVSIVSFMVGLPGETEQDLRDTVSVAKQLKATVCAFNFFTPLPGTKLYDDAVREGKYKPPKDFDEHVKLQFGERLTCNLSNVSSKDLKIVQRYFQLRSLTFKSDSGERIESKFLFIKIFKNAIKSISGHGIIHFIKSGFYGFVDLMQAISIFLHPFIRKKYGLDFKKHNEQS